MFNQVNLHDLGLDFQEYDPGANRTIRAIFCGFSTYFYGVFDLQNVKYIFLDIRIDLESLSLSDGQTGQMPKQSLSRKNSVCRTNSLHSTLSSGTGSHRASHNGRAHRKLCRLKAVYMRPNNQSR